MGIQGVNNNNPYWGLYNKETQTGAAASAAGTAAAGAAADKAQDAQEKVNQDTVSISASTDSLAAKGYGDMKKLSGKQLQAIQDQQLQSFNSMLTKMLGKQADISGIASGKKSAQLLDLSLYNLTPEQAKANIAEDGEWGVDAVATRIMDMAVALSGGDSSKLSVLRDAVEKGFKAAGNLLGSKVPSITTQTHEEVMNRFDYLEKNGTLDGYGKSKEDSTNNGATKVEA